MKEKEDRLAEKELARLENEEAKRLRQVEVDKRKKEREEEKEQRKRERELEVLKTRAAKRARGSTRDEELDKFHTPNPVGQTWSLADGVPSLSSGDLLMVWNFLSAHGRSLASPQLSLNTLRGALSVPARAAELTDVHLALMRCLLMDMDRIPDPATGLIAEPRRASLLTALTWPYMACMYLEENVERLGLKEEQVSGMLWEQEYHTIDAQWKLELLTILCNECLSCEPVKSSIDDYKFTAPQYVYLSP